MVAGIGSLPYLSRLNTDRTARHFNLTVARQDEAGPVFYWSVLAEFFQYSHLSRAQRIACGLSSAQMFIKRLRQKERIRIIDLPKSGDHRGSSRNQEGSTQICNTFRPLNMSD